MIRLEIRKSDKSCNRIFNGESNISLERINEERLCYALCMIGQRACDGISPGETGKECKYWYHRKYEKPVSNLSIKDILLNIYNKYCI